MAEECPLCGDQGYPVAVAVQCVVNGRVRICNPNEGKITYLHEEQ